MHDHAIRIVERSASFRTILENALLLHATLVTQRQNDAMAEMTEFSLTQNEQVKKVSGWAAILFAPTLVGTIYGMNFDYMPELHWMFGYPDGARPDGHDQRHALRRLQAQGLAVAASGSRPCRRPPVTSVRCESMD